MLLTVCDQPAHRQEQSRRETCSLTNAIAIY
jgi:hypothetical protein